MQPITDYTPQLSAGILIQGPPGSGKTTLACQFPEPYVLDCDLNLTGTIKWLRKNNLPLPVGFDTIDYDEKGKEVKLPFAYLRVSSCLKAVINLTTVKTIIIDGTTRMSDYIIAEVMKQQSITAMRIQDWGAYLYIWKTFINEMRSACYKTGKTLIIIAHEKVEKDDVSGMFRYSINLPGQFAGLIGGMMSDVWRCEVEERAGKHTWKVRTLPSARVDLKNSMGLPASFDATWTEIAKALKDAGADLTKPA